MNKTDILKLAVPRRFLLLLAGLAWFGVGTMLFVLACSWLSGLQRTLQCVYMGGGIAAAVVIHTFGFQKIADKNIHRILSKVGRQCVFSFFTPKSYILILVMVTMGRTLRHSAMPKPYLAVLYTAIGVALILSSVKYLRAFIQETQGRAGHEASTSTDDTGACN